MKFMKRTKWLESNLNLEEQFYQQFSRAEKNYVIASSKLKQ